MDKVKKWDEINGSGTSEEKMEAFLTDANNTYAILQLRYSDETAHERFESLNGLKRQGIEPTMDHYEVIYVAPLLPYKDRDVMLESLYATFNVDHPEDLNIGHISLVMISIFSKSRLSRIVNMHQSCILKQIHGQFPIFLLLFHIYAETFAG